MSLPNAQEIELISQLRIRMGELLKEDQTTDLFLVRWIRAREGNLDLAEQMLRQSLKWREENDMDNVLSWVPPEDLAEMCPVEFLGYDKFNSPVTYIPTGKWNLKKVLQLGHKDAFLKHIDHMFEQSLERMKGKFTPTGEPVTQAAFISNMEYFSYRTMASVGVVDMLLQCVKRFEANRPETVRKMIILNAGTAFAALFALMKPLLSERTFGKMFIFSVGNFVKCKDLLKEDMPLDIIPPKLGGTNADFKDLPNLDVSTTKDQGDELDNLTVTVPAADKLILLFTVDKAGSTISWSFKTDKYDIAFAVHCGDKVYVENSRVNSHEQASEGTITCETKGDYVFTYDNTYSRLRTKSLEYKVEIKTPEGTKQVSFA